MQNISGAMHVCRQAGIEDAVFAEAISSFRGASKRLEYVDGNDKLSVYLDFAHAPSKVKATVDAVKDHFKERKVVACLELHTYSSLNKDFLSQYEGALEHADIAMVYYNPHTIALKRLPDISTEMVIQAFCRKDLMVFNDSAEMLKALEKSDWDNSVLLLMSSGNFDGLQSGDIARKVLG
jgi:UDP-N-acetylmuramate: L-alanyl-gamma-D-glutamyl-meso-diaminopimelate ligase